MIEIAIVPLLKATLAAASAAWGVLIAEGNLCVATLVIPLLGVVVHMTLLYSDRLRGKRAEGAT